MARIQASFRGIHEQVAPSGSKPQAKLFRRMVLMRLRLSGGTEIASKRQAGAHRIDEKPRTTPDRPERTGPIRIPKPERRLQNPVNGGQGNGGKGINALETDSFATIPLPPSAVLQSALGVRDQSTRRGLDGREESTPAEARVLNARTNRDRRSWRPHPVQT